ncbi:predicted protein [Nematostella vectensis]|uniref:Protein DGCR6 n=1 Tax=Nematostella vectensis TaxID=45351 RepID=A7RPC4_NEMVE|nr:predicted protein [Nematostella vectensis]|eukprot:XP_001638724.1 predicted protein [Nematostella vectensis]
MSDVQCSSSFLHSKYKGKFTYDVLADVATSLLDGTVFEIVKGLEDIQQLTERNLLNKRMKVINSHKVQRMEQAKKHKEEIEKNQHRPHHIPIVEKTNEEDKEKLEQRLETEITSMDQKLVLELDQIVCDQQATLERAGVPLFFVTNNPDDVRLQMYLLEFIQQLIPGPS